MKFPLHTEKSCSELLQQSDEQLGKELRLMLEHLQITYQTMRIIIPYSLNKNYCLALTAVKREEYNEFGGF